MKKTYIIPTMAVTFVEAQQIIAESTPFDSSQQNKLGQGEILVKGQGNSQNYDVWDDDWSK